MTTTTLTITTSAEVTPEQLFDFIKALCERGPEPCMLPEAVYEALDESEIWVEEDECDDLLTIAHMDGYAKGSQGLKALILNNTILRERVVGLKARLEAWEWLWQVQGIAAFRDVMNLNARAEIIASYAEAWAIVVHCEATA